MKVEIEMYIDEDDETIVMQKVPSLTKQAKEVGFKIGEIEFKISKHKQHEDRNYNKHYNEDNKELGGTELGSIFEFFLMCGSVVAILRKLVQTHFFSGYLIMAVAHLIQATCLYKVFHIFSSSIYII